MRKNCIVGVVAALMLFFSFTQGYAQGQDSAELVKQAWGASADRDMRKLEELVNQCLNLYGQQARAQQARLKNFPSRGKEKDYQALNDVGTILFVKAEALMNTGKTEEAIRLFKQIISEYKWAQAWDPRGWYWSVAEKSQASIDRITGVARPQEEHKAKKAPRTVPKLHTPGTDQVIDYTKYGQFLNVGTEQYHYTIQDPKGLSAAAGEGIYPNTGAVLKNPGYKKARKAGRLKGSHWDFVHTDDLEAAYFKWALAPEPWGVKLFYIGLIFEKAKMYKEALKAYHAIVVHFPKAVGWTYWKTPWYPAQAAIAKIKHIIRIHPEFNLKTKWMKVEVKNGFDNNIHNDEIITYPGLITEKDFWDQVKANIPDFWREQRLGKIKKEFGRGKVRLVQYENDHWQLLVNGQPYVIHGMTYAPTKVGQSPDKGTLANWMTEDTNKNGLIDGPYEAWVDKNKNNRQDADEPTLGDFQIMKDMGVNTLRIYHQPQKPDKALLRKMHQEYGFHVIMGDFLGKYAIGSGASWGEGTDYENPTHRANMLKSVRNMVMEYKDEPYLLMWLLGNENNYGVASNADKKPEAFFRFVNEVAKMIKSIDPNHPVAISNGDTLYLDIFAEYAPEVDIFAANVYRGDYGFGSFWEQVHDAAGKPAFITEYGCPAFGAHMTLEEGEQAQSDYHKGNWLDIADNMAGTKEGVGNALGGVIFEWMDEWWKNYEPYLHDRVSDAIGPFPGGYYYEEWFGLVGQGDGRKSPFLRQLRKSYYMYQELWTKN